MKRSGRKQSAFTAGELASSVWERDDFKYFWVGLREAVNVDITPQGGLTVRPGMRRRALLSASSERLFPFTASNGATYDIVADQADFSVYSGSTLLDVVAHGLGGPVLSDLNMAQQLDTGILTHRAVRPRRLKHVGPTSWSIDFVPIAGTPSYNYGAVYTNAIPAEWDLELIGFRTGEPPTNSDVIFTLTASGVETTTTRVAMNNDTDAPTNAVYLRDALLALPNVEPGIDVIVVDAVDDRYRVIFSGEGNEGDKWALSGRVVNKADAAVVCSKRVPGVAAGEDIISDARGWPACSAFYQQRLLLGGFASLPNTYMVSATGDYFNFDQRNDTAAGAFVVPMDIPGGEAIQRIVPARDLLILTNKAEYSIAEREISKSKPPVHVEASRNGARGRAISENEGAVLFAFGKGGGIGEMRWTDVSGNYATGDLGLLAPHLVKNVADLAVRGKTGSQQGNRIGMIREDGSAALGTLLREQEVTAFTQVGSDGSFRAISCNGQNELVAIVARPHSGGVQRTLEVFDEDLLLDDAISVTLSPAGSYVGGLGAYEGRQVWAIADGNVVGPFMVAGGAVELGRVSSAVTIGRWMPPRISTLPLSREVGPKVVVTGRGRIHSVHLNLEDTTSIAISVNGRPARDIPLFPYGTITSGVSELSMGFTGRRSIRNLRGWKDDPYITITQLRPGRLTLKSIVVEAAL